MDSRRNFLLNSAGYLGSGLGGVALASLLASDGALAAGSPESHGELRGLHHAPKAKRVCTILHVGAASHIDLFDYKPALVKRHGQAATLANRSKRFKTGWGLG